MQWTKAIDDPPTWRLSDGRRQLAEIVRDDRYGTFLWYRTTTLADDGVPPGSGSEESLNEAKKRATVGLPV